ncbi:hypothetical protein CBS147338_6062 [Penicillium roqueforti]|nr:hypothetical protein CBS147338_6062 [Penicillium roqueforti]
MANVPELRYVVVGLEQKGFGDELKRFIGLVAEHTRSELEPQKLFDVLVCLGTEIQNVKSAVPKPDGIFEYVSKSLVWKTGLPVRSAVLKPHAGELVVGWVTTSESSLLYLVAGTTLWSGLSYVFSNNAVKILSKEEIQKRIAQAAAKRK